MLSSDAELEAVEAAVAAFLPSLSQTMGRDMSDEMEQRIQMTMTMRSSFLPEEGADTRRSMVMQELLANDLLGVDTIVRVTGLTGSRASELNNRVGTVVLHQPAAIARVLLQPSRSAPRVNVAVVPLKDTADWDPDHCHILRIKGMNLRPASTGELTEKLAELISDYDPRTDTAQHLEAFWKHCNSAPSPAEEDSSDEDQTTGDEDVSQNDDGAGGKSARVQQPADQSSTEMTLFIPYRCEVAGCKISAKLRKCARCAMVMYCSTHHQHADWSRHKIECKHLASLGVLGRAFVPAEELLRFPLGTQRERELTPRPRPAPNPDVDSPDSAEDDEFEYHPELQAEYSKWEEDNGLIPDETAVCAICAGQKNLERADCCGNWICNNEKDYQLYSYSRHFCSRSHRMYTCCGSHHAEGHKGDWRSCEPCTDRLGGARYYATNVYNVTPALESPRGSTMVTAACTRCGVRVAYGIERPADPVYAYDGVVCATCQGQALQQFLHDGSR